jgi:hypothetical protein
VAGGGWGKKDQERNTHYTILTRQYARAIQYGLRITHNTITYHATSLYILRGVAFSFITRMNRI